MSRFLLAAEADKIQDLLFRSSHLREVVGGSQLLVRFCEKVPKYLLPRYGGDPDRDVIIHDGGSFRILFDERAQAEAFGEELAEAYRLVTGGSLTVAEPVEAPDGAFGSSAFLANEALRKAKRWRQGWHSPEQMPYLAFCASCGIGLAVAYQAYHPNEEQYLCSSCQNKYAERARGFKDFLEPFRREVVEGEPELEGAGWPGYEKPGDGSQNGPNGPDDILENIAAYDPRQYVAYLLADGNDMGTVFSKCVEIEQMRELSKGLGRVIRRALAIPTKELMKTTQRENGQNLSIPVWPLIMGGDDLFALIPAPWALDFARRFCEVYESEMAALLKDIGLADEVRPSVSTAVVICKSKHPYSHAHEIGDARLKEAKRLGKQLTLCEKQPKTGPRSTVNFEVVLGGRLADTVDSGEYRSTLRPYFATSGGPEESALSITRLLDLRRELRALPNRRLAELQQLFDHAPRLSEKDELNSWNRTLNRLLERIERFSEEAGRILRRLMEEPGDKWPGKPWRYVIRGSGHWYGHELPDLLEAWDFAFRVDKLRSEYEGED
ncbi:Cas10/Cmr2 second palm domain-containing protein [Kyrpidia tusciae]|uniref:Cas10/Cmr2 second palm domain-containing protein n=1 Tax=Kyrpidia tusciae (strain DSM 2912 / NBRC 15312 / T2) TaxID=562970 RepID=D5WRW8_KYRT2|nr:hypothetical protein [Kyrpidia tusciae]ADG06920.1 conserved hypothetical protein [Kyrpidia tusciae DSM 2912]